MPQQHQTEAQQLSDGQQHIARLFLKDLPVICLDQPAAPLDALKRGRTVVIIPHSLAQIIGADVAYVLSKAAWWKAAPASCFMPRAGPAVASSMLRPAA
ncbi:hypothetical protein [Hymenobacter coalescens]